MKERVAAKRYAKAIFELARDAGEIERVEADMQRLALACVEVPSLIKALVDARVPIKKKCEVFGMIAVKLELRKTVTNAVKLLIENERAAIIPMIADDITRLKEHCAQLAVTRAIIADAALSKELKTRIEEAVGSALGLAARCDVDVDQSLIGGFAVWLGDTRYDASVRGKLERMRESLWKSKSMK